MELDKIIYDLLMATSAVTTVVGDRISLEQLPQDAALPAITFETTGLIGSTEGTAPIYESRVRVNAWSATQAIAASVAANADAALHGYQIKSGSLWLKSLERDGRERLYDEDLDVWGVSYTYRAMVILG